MGRLWDDHFADLGYLSKFDGVQDARFTINSPNGWDFTSILTKIINKSKNKTSQQVLRKTIDVSNKYEDQNDRIGKIYRLKTSNDSFSWEF